MKTCNDAPVGYKDHPPLGHWVEWYGGDCPVHPLATLDYQMRNGERCVDTADQLDWSINGDEWDVVRFCILEEYKPEPEKVAREVYMREMELFTFRFLGEAHEEPSFSRISWEECSKGDEGATLFREVIQ